MWKPLTSKSEPRRTSASDGNAAWSRFAGHPAIVLSTVRDTQEIEALVAAAGLRNVAVLRQVRQRPDAVTFFGKGRLEQVRETIRQHPHPLASGGGPIVVVNAELKPSTLFNLEDELRVEVWDRVRLILEIFQRNARIKEARLQVELARLRYELPFVHEALHRQLTGEHPGFMGGGELEARQYETQLRRRTKRILGELARLTKERRMRRTGRRRSGLRLVAIAGYTNSGKSTLLNALTGSQVEAKDRVFTTLQTATRRLREGFQASGYPDLLFTDTVGFIEDLPPWLVDAFSSTLEEIGQADAVLLVIDASEPISVVERKVEAAIEILDRVHAPRSLVVCLNKTDQTSSEHQEELRTRLRSLPLPSDRPILSISAQNGDGLQELVDVLLSEVLESKLAFVEIDRTVPEHLRFESWLRDRTEVLAAEDAGPRRRFRVRCGAPSWGLLVREARTAGAQVRTEPSSGNEGAGPP